MELLGLVKRTEGGSDIIVTEQGEIQASAALQVLWEYYNNPKPADSSGGRSSRIPVEITKGYVKNKISRVHRQRVLDARLLENLERRGDDYYSNAGNFIESLVTDRASDLPGSVVDALKKLVVGDELADDYLDAVVEQISQYLEIKREDVEIPHRVISGEINKLLATFHEAVSISRKDLMSEILEPLDLTPDDRFVWDIVEHDSKGYSEETQGILAKWDTYFDPLTNRSAGTSYYNRIVPHTDEFDTFSPELEENEFEVALHNVVRDSISELHELIVARLAETAR